MFKIGNISIKNKTLLAPMAGISNPAYFSICEEFGLSYAVTELISSEAIVRENKKTFDMLKGIEKLNIPFAIQIFGSDPKVMSKAASILEKKYNLSAIDINMGCPVPKVVKSGAGSALLKDVDKVFDIVSSVVQSVSVPVTVKIRSGWDNDSINCVSVARACEKAGASSLAIHARTRSQGYSGLADWSAIKAVKDAVSIPVIGNGDVKNCFDAKKMIDETGCDAIMIGRAALGNPWIIRECNEYLDNNTVIEKPTSVDKISMIKKHYNLLKKINGEKSALLEIRSHALWYLKGIPGIKSYKNLLVSTKSESDFLSVLDSISIDK